MHKKGAKPLIYSAIIIFIVFLLVRYLFPTVEGFQDLSRWLWSAFLNNWIYVPSGNNVNINSADVYSTFVYSPRARGFIPNTMTNMDWGTLQNKPGDNLPESLNYPPGNGNYLYSEALGGYIWLPSSYPRPLQDNAALVKEFAWSTYYNSFVPYSYIHSFENPNKDTTSKARPDQVYDDGTWTWVDNLGTGGGYAWIRARSPANTKNEIGKTLKYSFWPFLQAWLPDEEFGKVPTSRASLGTVRSTTATTADIDESTNADNEGRGPRMSPTDLSATRTTTTKGRTDLPDGSICILPVRK